MSGGSYNHGYINIEYEYVGRMKDTELNEMPNFDAKIFKEITGIEVQE